MYRVSYLQRLRAGALGAACLIGLLIVTSAWASDRLASGAAAASTRQVYEAWAGADASALGWSAYTGLTAALFGDLRESGWRLRASGSYGEYRYSRSYWDSAAKDELNLRFTGHRWAFDTLVGYQHSWGPLTVKAFAGITQVRKLDSAAPGSPIALDDENGFQGDRLGLKLALETWTRLSHWGFLQADASWSQPTDSYATRLRLGYRLSPAWSIGPEISAFGNLLPDQGRVGGFVRFEWGRGEVSLSAGMGGDQRLDEPYGSVNALFRF